MVDSARTGETLKSALDLSIKYYSGLLELSTNYLQAIGSLVTRGGEAGHHRANPDAAPSPPLLLVARPGEEATASFLVQNTLREGVTARISVRAAGPAAALMVDPQTASLAPGEQCVVRARVTISPEMVVGQDYHGEFAVPELASRTIPFVIRPLADTAASS
jgi:hypothetical protein